MPNHPVGLHEFDVFLSHSSRDAAKVRAIADVLRMEGLKVWMAPDSIEPGSPVIQAITQGVAKSRKVVFCISSASLASDYVELETRIATGIDPSNFHRVVVPALLEKC